MAPVISLNGRLGWRYGRREKSIVGTQQLIGHWWPQQRDTRQTGEDAATQALSFKAIVELNTQQLQAANQTLPLAAGMSVSAEIIQDKRTVLEYLLSPVQRVASEAGRER